MYKSKSFANLKIYGGNPRMDLGECFIGFGDGRPWNPLYWN